MTGGASSGNWGLRLRVFVVRAFAGIRRRVTEVHQRFTAAWRRRRDRGHLPALCDHLASLLDAGLPLDQALGHLTATRFQGSRSLTAASLAVEQGLPLSEAWTGDVPYLLSSLLAAGELTGNLPRVLHLWVAHVEQMRAWRERLVRIVGYPALLLSGMVALVVYVARVVLPTFLSVYTQLGLPAPVSTRVLERVLSQLPAILGGVLVLVSLSLAGMYVIRRNVPSLWSRIHRRFPGYGLWLLARTHRLCMLLRLLLDAGLPLLEGVQSLQRMVRPQWLAEAGQTIASGILSGKALTTAFGGEWDPLLSVLLEWAERTGELPTAFDRVEKYTRERLRHRTDTLLQVLEPGLTLLMGALVAGTMFTVFVPMYDLMAAVAAGHGAG